MTDDFIKDALKDKKPPSNDTLRIQLVNQSFIQGVRNSRDFRRFVWFLIGESGLVGQPFTGHRETTDFNCGNRNTGILLFQMIDQFCPDYFSIMMKEAKEDSTYDHGNNPSNTGSSSPSGGGNTGSSGPDNPYASGRAVNPSDSIAVINTPGSSV